MPLTPFHFGPAAAFAFLFPRRLDFFVFLGANAVIDIQPLIVILSGSQAGPHGWTHTFLFSTLLGGAWGWLIGVWPFGRRPSWVGAGRARAVVSGILGAWSHVLLDAPLYSDIRPFFPWTGNPLRGLIPMGAMYLFCSLMFGAAIVIYRRKRRSPHG